jgi:uncharacterized protein YigE (DUF2233 family)
MMKALLLAVTCVASGAFALDQRQVRLDGQEVTVVTVDLKVDALRLFHRDAEGKPLKRLTRLAEWLGTQRLSLAFGMNAGMYHGDFSAVGLYVAGGRELSPLNLTAGAGNFFLMPNGVFALTDQGAVILPSPEYRSIKETVLYATQSGPLLLSRGRVHPKFMPGSKNKLIRNGVGLRSRSELVFAISEGPVNFYDFAVMFRDQLHCADALFLDGTVSSLYCPELKREDFRMELGPMLGVVRDVR